MKRSDFPRPFMTALIDLNSEAAYKDHGEVARKSPRLLPVPKQTVAKSSTLVLENWRKNVKIYPQVYFLVGHDTEIGVDSASEKTVLGVGLGLAFHDDGIEMASPDPSARDKHMCYWYSLYTDSSQFLSDEMVENVNIRDLTLTMESETLGRQEYAQKDLLFDAVETLSEMSCLVSFKKYDLISLGAANAPITVPTDKKFKKGEVITVDGGILGKLEITVDDQRDDTVIPTWYPRDFYLNRN